MANGRGERREFSRQHVHAWRRNGQRRQEHELNLQTFNVWVGRLRDEFRPTGTRPDEADQSETATYVPVEVTSESETGAATGTTDPPIEIEAGGVTLRVTQDADTEVITAARRSA